MGSVVWISTFTRLVCFPLREKPMFDLFITITGAIFCVLICGQLYLITKKTSPLTKTEQSYILSKRICQGLLGLIVTDVMCEKYIHGWNHRATASNWISYITNGIKGANEIIFTEFQHECLTNPDFNYKDFLDKNGYIDNDKFCEYCREKYKRFLIEFHNMLRESFK